MLYTLRDFPRHGMQILHFISVIFHVFYYIFPEFPRVINRNLYLWQLHNIEIVHAKIHARYDGPRGISCCANDENMDQGDPSEIGGKIRVILGTSLA
jgi:hypothetical protein